VQRSRPHEPEGRSRHPEQTQHSVKGPSGGDGQKQIDGEPQPHRREPVEMNHPGAWVQRSRRKAAMKLTAKKANAASKAALAAGWLMSNPRRTNR